MCGQWPQFLLESTRIVEQQLNNNFSCCPYRVSVLNGEVSTKRELAVNGVYGPFREHRRRKCQYLYLLLRSFLFSVRLDIVFLKYWRNFTRFWQNAHVAITVISDSSRIVLQSDRLRRSWLTTSNLLMFLVDLWHGLGLVFIKVCRSGHYPFWLRAANSQWEPSGLQCSQPSPGIAGFAVRKKVSCEQAHLVRVSGALVRNPTTRGCSQARKKSAVMP